MVKASPVRDGSELAVYRRGGDAEICSSNGTLLYLLKRPWENRFDREWHFVLLEGKTIFQAGQPPLLTLIR